MTWINVVEPENATGSLAQFYARIAGSSGVVDNVLKVHSLRPHTLLGHMTLYKNVLHHGGNTLPMWYLECVGVYVSRLNQCAYCVDHHFEGLVRLLGDRTRAEGLKAAMSRHQFEDLLEPRFAAGLAYARKLTDTPSLMHHDDVAALRDTGLNDGEILEINQVAAYFAYANRTALGLGVSTDGDVLGLSPGDAADPDNWSHG